MTNHSISIAAVGDIGFAGRLSDSPANHILKSVSPTLHQHDLVIGNLECPLVDTGKAIPGKCTFKGDPGWGTVLKESGISFVSLANNHLMDYGEVGLFNTLKCLYNTGIGFAGAGRDLEEAQEPAVIELKGYKIAILARTAVTVASPSHASESQPGVARFDLDEVTNRVHEWKSRADIVILCLHWGIEFYSYPSGQQRHLAAKLARAGIDILFGHHPHVQQGIEQKYNTLIAYSLGNFLFDDFSWSFINDDGQLQESTIRLSDSERQGGILSITLSGDKLSRYHFFPTRFEANGIVRFDHNDERQRDVEKPTSRLKLPFYSYLWRLYSIRREWVLRIRPLLSSAISWRRLKKLRPKHFRQLVGHLRKSTKIASEKSTNPHDA